MNQPKPASPAPDQASPGRRAVEIATLFRRRLLAGVVAAGLAIGVAAPADAINVGGSTPFGLTPVPVYNGQARPYFQVNLAPGQTASDAVIVTNAGKTTTTLQISPSTGITAPNSGSAFGGYFQKCVGDGCWVTGLPSTVTLKPGERETLRFTVGIPDATPLQQYLAGITAQPATPPPAVSIGSNGQASAKAVIVTQITVGVAVTVGSYSQLRTRLDIPSVTAGTAGRTPRIDVHLRNTGQTFTKATGAVSCTIAGKRLSYPIAVNTILPGDAALVPIDAPRLPVGKPLPCTVRLRYGNGLTSVWSGTIKIPTIPNSIIIHTGPGTYSTLPTGGIPAWAIALIVIGGLTLTALTTLALLLLRRHRHVPTQ
jgi:hypothetical protein